MNRRETLGTNDQDVLAILSSHHAPMSAYDILDALKGTQMRAAVQVYRALQKLLKCHLIHRVESLNAFVVCEHDCHGSMPGFLVCESCGSVSEFDPSEAVAALTNKATGFRIDGISLELKGRCSACQSNESSIQ